MSGREVGVGAYGRAVGILVAGGILAGAAAALILPRPDRPAVGVVDQATPTPEPQPTVTPALASRTEDAVPTPTNTHSFIETPTSTPTLVATVDPVPAPEVEMPTATPAATAAPTVTHTFPVQPVSAASYGRDHHDYPATDIFAPCGTLLVSVVDGVVDEMTTADRWDPAVNDPDTRGGLSIAIVGDDGVRHYMSHLASIESGIVPGARVAGGRPIGTLGRSGNAASTPCHVHYGLSPPRGPGDTLVRRGVIWPWPYLDAWAAGDMTRSPLQEVQAWATANP